MVYKLASMQKTGPRLQGTVLVGVATGRELRNHSAGRNSPPLQFLAYNVHVTFWPS